MYEIDDSELFMNCMLMALKYYPMNPVNSNHEQREIMSALQNGSNEKLENMEAEYLNITDYPIDNAK